jgi:BirA family biotin operon repressor/biotin-[acetyl-CoA-carboxylase] ligase
MPPVHPDLAHWQGEPVGVWEALWGIPRFEAWSEVGSTNDRARDLALEGAVPWTTVVALRQREGRGRAGRSWQSGQGAGVWVSLILQPRAQAQAQLLPLVAGVALARAVEAGAALRPADAAEERGQAALKWPNDVWWGGRKIAGILCESVGPRIVVGVGINLRVPREGFAEAHASRAGALEDLSGRNWSESWLLGRLIRELRTLWEPPRLRFESDLLAAWNARDHLRDRPVRVGSVAGRARGVTADGALRIETDAGEVIPVRAGHVEWGEEVRPAYDPDLAEE